MDVTNRYPGSFLRDHVLVPNTVLLNCASIRIIRVKEALIVSAVVEAAVNVLFIIEQFKHTVANAPGRFIVILAFQYPTV